MYTYMISTNIFINSIYLKNNRNRNKNVSKRSKIKLEHNYLINNNVVRHLDLNKSKCPHTLIELSAKQWNRCSKNSIIVQGLIEDATVKKHPTISYNSVTYGSNIILKKRSCVSNDKRMHWRSPQLCNMSGGYLLIVGEKLNSWSIIKI